MDFSLSNEQRAWQMKARKFAEEEIQPISLELDETPDAHGTFDWDIIEKGSKLGFRTLAVPKECGGEGTDFVTQALVMAELARGDSAISKTFSQNWKWSHLIAAACNDEQKERFLKPFLADHRFLLGKGITEPNAGSDNRMPPKDAPKAGLQAARRAPGRRMDPERREVLHRQRPVGKLFFVDARTNPERAAAPGHHHVPGAERDTPGFRIGKVFNKSGWRFYQNAELIFENARVPHANVVGDVNTSDMKTAAAGDRTGGDIFGDLELAANALGVCDDACEQAMKHAKHRQAGRQAAVRAAAGPAQAQQDAHADRGAALAT